MGKLINNLDLRGPTDWRPSSPSSSRPPNSSLESDSVFGTILLIVLSLVVGGVTHGYGFFPFLIWGLWLGLKPFDSDAK